MSLDQASNALIWSSMIVYTLAMYFFAGQLAFGRAPRQRALSAQNPVRAAELATVGAPLRPGTSRPQGPVALLDADPVEQEKLGRRGGSAVALTTLAFVLHLASVVTRGLATGRAPWSNMYEFSTASALVAMGAYLVMLRRRDVRYLGLFVVLPVLVVLGLAVRVFYIPADDVVPALDSIWIFIHVSAAIVATGLLTVAASQTILYLVQERRERVPVSRRKPSFMDRFPDAATLDRSAYRLHAFAFPIWTFMVITGAVWAQEAWGRSWGWDPKEVWAFITWVVYAAYLHARATAGWRGSKAAAVALFAYGTVLFNYVVVNVWFSGLHSYGGVH